MDAQREVGLFLEKLSAWRDESHKEFSNIINIHSSVINKGVNDLVEEVSDLKVKLSDVTKERDGLLETVHNLSNEIRQRNDELNSPQLLLEHEELNMKETQGAIIPGSEVEDVKQKMQE